MANADDDAWPALMCISVCVGDVTTVLNLLRDRPALANCRVNGMQPLMLAATRRNLEMARLLLDHGADLSSSTDHGFSPVLVPAVTGQAAMMELLLDRGADGRAIQPAGASPLMMASVRGQCDVMSVLLDRLGPAIMDDQIEQQGVFMTAFECGVAGKQQAAVRLLLARGADFTRYTLTQFRRIKESACLTLIEESWRAYTLHRARRLHNEQMLTRVITRATNAPLPSYLKRRIEGGRPLPGLEVAGRPVRSGTKRKWSWFQEREREEEVVSVAEHVLKGWPQELFHELMLTIGHTTGETLPQAVEENNEQGES